MRIGSVYDKVLWVPCLYLPVIPISQINQCPQLLHLRCGYNLRSLEYDPRDALGARWLSDAAVVVVEVLGDVCEVFSQRDFQIVHARGEGGKAEGIDEAGLLGGWGLRGEQGELFIKEDWEHYAAVRLELLVDDLQLCCKLSIVDSMLTGRLPPECIQIVLIPLAVFIPQYEWVSTSILPHVYLQPAVTVTQLKCRILYRHEGEGELYEIIWRGLGGVDVHGGLGRAWGTEGILPVLAVLGIVNC